MKITVLIDGDSKIINLQESIVTTNFEYIFTKRATIFWSYKNVDAYSLEVLRVGAKKKPHTFENGYYSFDDIAKEIKTVENINELGKKDSTIVSLPITTTQSLFGSVTEYVDIESRLPIDKGVINQLQFNVKDQDDKPVNIGKVLLECYIV